MDLPEDLPQELAWHIIKFLTHPTADLIKERLRAHDVSMDRQKSFHKFHFQNLGYCYDFLKAEYESEMLPFSF